MPFQKTTLIVKGNTTGGRWKRDISEDAVSSPGERSGQDGSSGGVKWSDSRFILKVKLTKLADGLDVGSERKRGLGIITQFLTSATE